MNSGGNAFTQVSQLKSIETATDPSNPTTGSPVLGGVTTSTSPTISNGSSSIIVGTDGVGKSGGSYQFQFTPSLPIPSEGAFTISIPSGISLPGIGVSGLSMVCETGCAKAGTLSYSGGDLTIKNAF